MTTYDAIVLGIGGVGSAALMHLARRGLRVLGIDRFTPPHDRGSSHGSTRIIRQAYFENAAYVPLLRRAYDLWAELEGAVGRKLYEETGLLQVGPDRGYVIPRIKACAAEHHLDIEEFTDSEISARFLGFAPHRDSAGVLERRAGYLQVEDCVQAHLSEAVRCGAELACNEEVRSWTASDRSVVVETARRRAEAAALVIAAGPWAAGVLNELKLPLTVLRKCVFWWKPLDASYAVAGGCPAFLFEVPGGLFYGFPQIDARGVKVAEHTGGQVLDDPLALDRNVRDADWRAVAEFIGGYLPRLTSDITDESVCMYTMSPDGQFVVDRHRLYPHVVFAAGLSGHGFKFAPVLGEALADLAVGNRPLLDLSFLSASRPGIREALP